MDEEQDLKKWSKYNKILTSVSVIPFLITGLAMNFMPDTVTMHYNASGVADRYGSKYENFLFCGIIVLFNIFWIMLIRFYKKKMQNTNEDKVKKEIGNNISILYFAAIGTTILFIIVQCVILLIASQYNTGNEMDSSNLIYMVSNASIGVLYIILGNIVPKAKRNGSVGVRTTWSMANDATWAASNRFGGISMVISGVIILFLSFLLKGKASLIAMFIIVLIDAGISIWYSYRMYQKYK